MNVYLDTSVVLRRLLRQRNAFRGWGDWDGAYSSVIMRVETLRTVDRLRLDGTIDDGERVAIVAELGRAIQRICLVPLSNSILDRAGQPFPTVLKTLDALHLSSALAAREHIGTDTLFLTHDRQLALGARSMGFEVKGV